MRADQMPRNSQRDAVDVPDYRHGAVVRRKQLLSMSSAAYDHGVVVGLRVSPSDELMLNVEWAGGATTAIHPANVEYVK